MEQELARSQAVIDGIMGAAGALTGFVLVFLALAVSTLLREETAPPLLRVYRIATALAFAAFVLGVVVIGLALLWLRGRNPTVYSLISWLVPAELFLVGLSAGMIAWKAVRR